MTDTENGLRADVFARPADDAPRRAYADWLTARGDGYGNFITAQLTGQTARAAASSPPSLNARRAASRSGPASSASGAASSSR